MHFDGESCGDVSAADGAAKCLSDIPNGIMKIERFIYKL